MTLDQKRNYPNYDPTGERRYWVDTGALGHPVEKYQQVSGNEGVGPFWDKVLKREISGQ
jgi:hypothetical protein